MDHDLVLNKLLPYRLGAVSALAIALKYRFLWDDPKPMQIYFDGELAIEGNSYGFLNPAIDSGLVHCRALLEFLGLCVRDGSLHNVKLPRRSDDIGIEAFSNAAGPLPLVTPAVAIARYTGDSAEAENALLAVFQATNKGLAHITRDFNISQADAKPIEIASRGIQALIISHVYTALGLPPPELEIKSRPRGGC